VLDFGIAKLRNAQATHATRAGMVMGTPYYMSPEQARGRGGVDHRTDIYALGVMLYELLSGEKPFMADDHSSVLNQIVGGPTPQLKEACPTLASELCAIVQQAIAKDPDARFQTAEAFAEGLLPFWPQTRRTSRTANVFGSRASRVNANDPHKTSAEPGLTVRVTGERRGLVSPVGVLVRRITDLGSPSVPKLAAVNAGLEFSDNTEPDALRKSSAPPSARSPAIAPEYPDTTPPEAKPERAREVAGVYPAARTGDDEGGTAEHTPVPTAVQTVSLGRTLAPLLIGVVAIAVMVATVLRAGSSADPAEAATAASPDESEQMEGTVEVIEGDWSDAPVDLELVPTGGGQSEPSGEAGTAVDGITTGSAGPSATAPAFGESSAVAVNTTSAQPEATARPEPSKAQGHLTVLTTPPDATLWIGGQRLGTTPLQRVRLAAGSHQVTLSHPLLGNQTRTVNIKHGELTELKLTFTPPDVDELMARQVGSAAAPSAALARPLPPTARNCEPRWELDSSGVRRLKPECLRAP
jgi:serine/threonine-protein kinase